MFSDGGNHLMTDDGRVPTHVNCTDTAGHVARKGP